MNAFRNILIKLSLKSRTLKELAPSHKDSFKGTDTFKSKVEYMQKIAQEGIQPAMTDEEARLVREEVVSLIGCCTDFYEYAVEEATDLMDRTYQTFKQLEEE